MTIAGKSELPDLDPTAHDMLELLATEYIRADGLSAEEHVLHLTLRKLYYTAKELATASSEQSEQYWLEYMQDIEDLLCSCGGVGFHSHIRRCPSAVVLQ